MAKAKKQAVDGNEAQDQSVDLAKQVEELTADLQRTRADFENFRKRADIDRSAARESGEAAAILKLLPVIDTIDMAISRVPEHLEKDPWAQGIAKISKRLESTLAALSVTRIAAQPGTPFNPDLHEAIQFDDEADGELEVVAEELQAGYKLGEAPIRHAMVKVTRQ